MKRLLALLFLLPLGALASITMPNAASVPSRTSGAAPLYVHFDLTAVDSSTTTREFHDVECRTNFGDGQAKAYWTTGAVPGFSKNEGRGLVAGHVYETAGTYTWEAVCYDGAVSGRVTGSITVTGEDAQWTTTNTTCVAQSTLPVQGVGGCPASAAVATQSNFVTAISTYAGAGKRVLFKRGDTFTVATTAVLNTAGPGYIGAYGTGAKPIISNTGSDNSLHVSTSVTPTISDWRIVDLQFSGGTANSNAIFGNGGIDKLTILRVDVTSHQEGFNFDTTTLDADNFSGATGHTVWDQLAIVDSSVTAPGSAIAQAGFVGADRMFIAGNNFDMENTGAHTFRVTYSGKGIISNNNLLRPGGLSGGNHALKMHAANTVLTDGATSGCPGACSATITGVASTTGIVVGMLVVNSACLQDNSKVLSTTANSITLDKTASANCSSPTGFAVHRFSSSTGVVGAGIGAGFTRYVLISDNKFSNSTSAYTVNFGPQNNGSDERVKDVVVERNWFTSGTTDQVGLVLSAVEVTVRANVIDLSGGTIGTNYGIYVFQDGIEPAPSLIRLYNNTVYLAGTSSDFAAIKLSIAGTVATTYPDQVTLKNNLAYAPLATTPKLIVPTSATNVTGAAGTNGNSTDNQTSVTLPFVATMPGAPVITDFKLSTAYAKNGGATVPVYSDIARRIWPTSTSAWDVGAWSTNVKTRGPACPTAGC